MKRALCLLALASCSRATEKPQPKAVAEPASIDAAPVTEARDAGMKTEAPRATPFTIVVRAHTTHPAPMAHGLGSAMPLVQRLPNGGLVVASEHARARADGAGPLSVELLGRGLDTDVLYRSVVVQGVQGMRWVWSDTNASVITLEEETGRSGPRLASYKLGANGFEPIRGAIGYYSAGLRGTSVLALERTAFEIPNSSMYPKGSPYEQNTWSLKPARVAVLAGPGPAPIIPPNTCPNAMSIAPDGTIAIAVEKCEPSPDRTFGVLRYAPGATTAKVEWFAQRTYKDAFLFEPTVLSASANEVYVADEDRLQTWNGKEWTSTTPFPGEIIRSISRAPNGDVWSVADNRLLKRASDATTWTEVKLPLTPADRLDEQLYAAPQATRSEHFLKTDVMPENQSVRAETAVEMNAHAVDAVGDDVLVLAYVEHEAFVLSTKPRGTVARIPSLPVQRARIAQTMKRKVANAPKDCPTSFIVFADGTKADAIKAALGQGSLSVGEATVEGQKRIVAYGEQEPTIAAMKKLGALGAKRLCGPAVVEREL